MRLRGGAGRVKQEFVWVYCNGFKRRYPNTLDGLTNAIDMLFEKDDVLPTIDVSKAWGVAQSSARSLLTASSDHPRSCQGCR